MLINVYCPAKDKAFSLDVGAELTLEVLKTLCHAELGSIPVEQIQVMRDGQKLTGDQKQLRQFNIADNDFLIVERGSPPPRPAATRPAAATNQRPGLPVIDFSNVQVPTRSNSTNQNQTRPTPTSTSATANSGPAYDDLTDVQAVATQLRNDPSTLALLRERNPALADALLSNDMTRFGAELGRIRQARADQEMERIRMLNADPMDPEVQRQIAEEIERSNIEENMNMAIENAPESFGQVVMLWINVRVNGNHVKAFVDSGAQMTIMSAECAERCNIMRLMDKRFAGVAIGVGTQKILGKIHLAQIQIENIFLPVSFSVMPEQPMDVLLGLDMLRRHQCIINLSDNSLSLSTPTGHTKTFFLGEAEIPTNQRSVPTSSAGAIKPSTSTTSSQPKPTEEKESGGDNDTKEASKTEEKMETSSTSTTKPDNSATQNTNTEAPVDGKLSQLMDMGFSSDEAKRELTECGGDLSNAIASLLRKRSGGNF